MSIYTTLELTREEAIEKAAEALTEDYNKSLKEVLSSWPNKKLENLLDPILKENLFNCIIKEK